METKNVLSYSVRKAALSGSVCLALLSAACRIAAAQEIEPNEFVPLPAGTNLAIGYYLYGHNTDYNVAGGPTVKGSGLEVNVGIVRLVHYTSLAGMPAGYEILEAVGSESGGHIGDDRLGSAFGASNPLLAAFLWPYTNPDLKQNFIVANYLNPPIGTYDKGSALNLAGAFSGSFGWSDDIQIGWDHAIGDHFSYTLGFDARFFGDTTVPAGKNSKDPDFRLQGWANWRFNPTYQVALGWESILGGSVYTNGAFNGEKSEFERIRANASAFVLPNLQLMLELNHDIVAVGGFKQVFGATARVVYVF